MGKTEELKYISLATTYEIDDNFDSEKFIKMRLRVQHDGINPNKSNFELENIEKAKESIKNIPILAHVIEDEDGNLDFGGHDMTIEEHKMNKGEYKLIYKESPIGVIPESCNYSIEEYNGKNYVYCDAYIWKGYSNYASDIIERDKDIKLSMEILVDGFSYDAKKKIYNITDYRYQGITFLNKEFGTGMENALATTDTFAEDENKQKFIMIMEELKETLSNYNKNNSDEGGSKVDEKVIALLDQYNITAEELDFDVSNMAVDEVEEKLKEKFNNDDSQKKPEKFVKSFELSHEEIKYALYNLLVVVEQEDNEWYFIDRVYDDKFEYLNFDGTKIYRQGYKKDGDVVEFIGERIELFQERLTKEEKEALDNMRSNYSLLEEQVSALTEFKEQKLAEERKEAEEILFTQFDEKLKGVEEYEKLKQNASDYDLDTLEKECFAILGMKISNFSTKPKQNKVKIEFSKTQEQKDEFEDLFEKYLKN